MVALLAVALPWSGIRAVEPSPELVPASEAQAWIDHTVPLPKQIEIRSKILVPAAAIRVVGPEQKEGLANRARDELCERIKTGAGRPLEAAFSVRLEIGGEAAAELKTLKHADQACRILPDPRGASLRLVALTPRGLYYAAKTLQQLLKVRSDGRVEIPLVRMTDWPDLEKRGLWGADCYAHLRWLADRKMNLVEQISDHGVSADGTPYARLKQGREPMVEEGPGCGVEPVPVVLHLEQLAGRGLFGAYPQLKAHGGQEGAVCYSKPEFTRILADWLVQLGRLPGVSEVDVWLAENLHQLGGCRCPECAKEDRDVLEARTVVAAWKRARAQLPDLRIFVLTSEETEKSNPRILEELPPEVRLWYYHSLYTYNSSENPVLRPYLARAAQAGRWVGVCPSVTAFVNFTHPFTGAAFIHYRMNEFVDKGMSGLIAYATPRVHYSLFNVEAAAEWSWNVKGRTPRQFARSWAVRRGLKDPEKFAAWSEALGPVAWDVYGSDWPNGEKRGQPPCVARRLRQGKLDGPGSTLWGVYRSPWGDLKSSQQLAHDVRQADQAVQMARELGDEGVLQESLVVQGYIQSLEALDALRQMLQPGGRVASDRRADAARFFQRYDESLRQAADSLPRWEATVRKAGDSGGFTEQPVKLIRTMREQMEKVQAALLAGAGG